MKPTKIGVIGSGTISTIYLKNLSSFPEIEIIGCSDLDIGKARAQAEKFGTEAKTVSELLDSEAEIILNLTVPSVHASVNQQILLAGKHAYCEKPLGMNPRETRETLLLAQQRNLKVGCAPDTVLGAGIQTAWKALRDNWIGHATAGLVHMLGPGVDNWHPNPFFYYKPGGGPLFDMGPYYLTTLHMLLGPVKAVTAVAKKTREQRITTVKEHFGKVMDVEVNTHYSGILEFANNVLITASFSFDVQATRAPRFELFGTEGTLAVPDPNTFGGPVEITTVSSPRGEWQSLPLNNPYFENSRGLGILDFVHAIHEDRQPRCDGHIAAHVVDVMTAWEESALQQTRIEVDSAPPVPAPMPVNPLYGFLNPY